MAQRASRKALRKRGLHVGRNRVVRLMATRGLVGRAKRQRQRNDDR